MTEAQWLASEDPAAMLGLFFAPNVLTAPKPSDRKLRLFAVACYQSWAVEPPSAIEEAVFRLAEEVAEGTANLPSDSNWIVLAEEASQAALFAVQDLQPNGVWKPKERDRQYAILLRDVVGNPYRPVTLPKGPPGICGGCDGTQVQHYYGGRLACEVCDGTGVSPRSSPCPWLTPDVLAIAQAAYDDRADDGTLQACHLGPLADALEDAGCDNEELLRHLRGWVVCPNCQGAGKARRGTATYGVSIGPCDECDKAGFVRSLGPHFRGCWAVDLILGKE